MDHFSARCALDILQRTLDKLTKPKIPFRLIRFSAVGLSGVAVNMGILIALTSGLGLPYALSSIIAIELSILSNFALNNAWTWSDCRTAPLTERLLKYHAVAGVTALAVNWFLLIVLTKFFEIDYRISNLIGIGAGMALNFSCNHAWTFRRGLAAASMLTAEPIFVGTGTSDGGERTVRPCREAAQPVSSKRMIWIVIAAVAALTIAKIFFAIHAELLPEEAYYWTYLQHPALSYFDHPPMVAWIIAIGTFLWGDGELGVRFGTILLSLGSTFWMYRLTRLWFGPACAAWAAVLFNLLPIFIGLGVFAFPDGPLIFFWLLTMYAVSKALGAGTNEESREKSGTRATGYWLLAGLAFGGALLSKYTAVLLGTSLGLFLLFSARHRVWLRRPQPWLAVAVALLVFTPVIVWNADHDWASFLFQSTRTVGQKPHVLKNVSEFWLMQLVVLGPIPLVVFAVAAWQSIQRGWLKRIDSWNFVASFFAPLFLVFVFASFKTEVHINWTAPAFLSLVIAGAAIFQKGLQTPISRLRWRQTGWLAVAFACAACLAATSTFIWGVPDFMTNSRLGGWRQLALSVNAEEKNLVQATSRAPFVIGADKYNLSAELGFYGRAPKDNVNDFILGRRGLGFRYWTELNSFENRPAVAVLTGMHEATLAKLREHFERLDVPKRCDIHAVGSRTRTVWLVNCYNYRKDARPINAALLKIDSMAPNFSVSASQK